MRSLLDVKPEEVPMRPEAGEIMRQRLASRNPADPCGSFFGFPLAGLVSEPIKMIQSPRVTAISEPHRGLSKAAPRFTWPDSSPPFLESALNTRGCCGQSSLTTSHRDRELTMCTVAAAPPAR
jgi:hypothetical protein